MRTVQKTASYSVMHLVIAFAVAYALTRDWRAALAIGMIEPIFQTLAFAMHERVWQRIDARGGRPGYTAPLAGSPAPA